MRKNLLLVVGLLIYTNIIANPKHEFRANWFTTHYAIDWPDTYATSEAKRAQQQQEMIDIFDKMVAGNMNAVCMQVRSLTDAMYKSSYEPWAKVLTGTRGKDPGYDPLAFAVEEAHKRGLELHIWVNPFRVTSSGTISTSDLIWKNAGQWIIKYDNGSFDGQIIDPGYPEAREYVINVLMEIVNNYDIDGILMDDYFYPYGGTTFEDAASKALHKPNDMVDVNQDGDTDDDWRRSNVDTCMKTLYDTIQAVKPWVRFGMGTFGIWSTQKKAAEAYGITLPSGIAGLDDYDVQACNPVEWVKNGYVDYINPQLYWSTQSTGQNYNVLCQWWSKDVCEHFSNQLPNGKKVHFFVSQAAYHAYDGYTGYDAGVEEIQKQLDINRTHLSSGYTGSVFYNTTAYCKMHKELANSHFIYKALPPAMDWKVIDTLSAPVDLQIVGTKLSWKHSTAERFTVYAFPKGHDATFALQDAKYLYRVVYGTTCSLEGLSDLDNTTIAVCAYDRFGVEYEAAIINEGSFPESDPNATEITWVLNGGEVIETVVPTNEELWELLKPDYIDFYTNMYEDFVPSDDRTIEDVLGFTWINSLNRGIAKEFMLQDTAWTWLSGYISSVADSDGYTLDTDNKWRYHLYSFFNCTNIAYRVDGYNAGSTADFTTAGKPEKWSKYYDGTTQEVITLPSQVDETYILPTPTHPDDLPFLGWYTTADFTGDKVFAIPAGWKGTLYASWDGYIQPSNVEIVLNPDLPMQIFDIMGRHIESTIDQLPSHVYIIKQGNNIFKLIK